jgi:hypothetical protein
VGEGKSLEMNTITNREALAYLYVQSYQRWKQASEDDKRAVLRRSQILDEMLRRMKQVYNTDEINRITRHAQLELDRVMDRPTEVKFVPGWWDADEGGK